MICTLMWILTSLALYSFIRNNSELPSLATKQIQIIRVLGNEFCTNPYIDNCRFSVINEIQHRDQFVQGVDVSWVLYRIVDIDLQSRLVKHMNSLGISFTIYPLHLQEYEAIPLKEIDSTEPSKLDFMHYFGTRNALRRGDLHDFQNLFNIGNRPLLSQSIKDLYTHRIEYLDSTRYYSSNGYSLPYNMELTIELIRYMKTSKNRISCDEELTVRVRCVGLINSSLENENNEHARLLQKVDSRRVSELHEWDVNSLAFFDVEVLSREKSLYMSGKAPESLTKLVHKMIQQAQVSMNNPLESVMDKSTIPPSGSKHDYLSPEFYCWPANSSVYFPCVVRDGFPYAGAKLHTPESLNFDHTRRFLMVSSAMKLTMGWYFTDNKEYAQKASKILQTWFINPETRMNPNLNYAQWRGQTRFGSVVDMIDLVPLLDCIRLLSAGGYFTDSDMELFRDWTERYVLWMSHALAAGNDYTSPNNHGVIYDLQLVALASFSRNTLGAIFTILDRTKYRIYSQINSTAMMPHELARPMCEHYQIFTLQLFHQLARISRHFGVNLLNIPCKGKDSPTSAICAATNYSSPIYNPTRGICPGDERGVKSTDWAQVNAYGSLHCNFKHKNHDIYNHSVLSGMFWYENLGIGSIGSWQNH